MTESTICTQSFQLSLMFNATIHIRNCGNYWNMNNVSNFTDSFSIQGAIRSEKFGVTTFNAARANFCMCTRT